MSILSFTK